MKRIKLIILLIAISVSYLYAQNDTPDSGSKGDDPYKELYDLQKKLEAKSKDVDKMQAEIDRLILDLQSTKEELQKEKASIKVAELKKQLSELKADTTRRGKEWRRFVGTLNQEFSVQKEELQGQIATLQGQHQKDDAKIQELANELGTLNKFRKVWLQQLADSVDGRWMSKTYSQIDSVELERAYTLYNEYADSDAKVKAARDKLGRLLNEFRIYREGVRCVNSPYDKAWVFDAYKKIEAVRGSVLGSKGDELDLLSKQLDYYEVTVEIFRDVIDAVASSIEGCISSKAALPLVNATLEKQESEDGNISAIKAIPWLNEQYRNYVKDLENNCLVKSPVADVIKNLKI